MARFAHEIVIDMETLEITSRRYSDYQGPVHLCKGGASKAQMATNNQISQNELNLAQQQLAMQQGQINQVNPTLQAIIANGGLLPAQRSALTSIAMNTLPQTYQNLQGQINNQLVQRGMTGGQFGGSGGVAGSFGALGAAEAQQQAGLLNNIELTAMQNLGGALNTSLGIGGMYGQNFGTSTGAGMNALQSATSAASATDQAQSGFWGSLFGALGTGAGIGAGIALK